MLISPASKVSVPLAVVIRTLSTTPDKVMYPTVLTNTPEDTVPLLIPVQVLLEEFSKSRISLQLSTYEAITAPVIEKAFELDTLVIVGVLSKDFPEDVYPEVMTPLPEVPN